MVYSKMLLLLLLSIGAVAGYDRSVNYWEAFAPGKLLQRLDELTTTNGQPVIAAAALSNPELPNAQAKLDEEVYDDDTDAADVDTEAEQGEGDDVVELDSAEAQSGEDYERNYEQFVREYFDRVPDDYEETDHEEHTEQLADDDDSIETQAEASNVQRQQKPREKRKQPHCRRVERKGQLCTICREPRNNEISETCSYSHEAEPQQYAYGSGSNYKRYRDQSKSAEQDTEQQQQRPQKRSERHTSVVEPRAEQSSSLCVRRQQGKSVCYDCKDSGGKRMSRCYDSAIQMNTQSKKSSQKPRGGKQSEQQQRIYKRTISYSYAQDTSQDELDTRAPKVIPSSATTISASPASPLHTGHSTGRRYTKILRRRTAIPHTI